ncbi:MULTISPECIES: enoyl-CoA hydratase [Roseomonadaceae]|uniref:Enoyl-CoA hydratase/isomerase family protein n=1 Tax=Falsiroseomonas oleicola TaxID=2801474 RepID=A0ABS6HHJ0_9PROT|nr:enoyl-CoA hydratase [Roseomonas oleicola]MBU8547133.1 enoyl-CoA hydratase/isomerase family protein [Roseomonas oleicola]
MDGMTLSLTTPKILARIEDGIGWLTFNQPEKRNAISLEMWEAVADAALRFTEDPAVRVVVMHGAGGKAFASGADISQFEKLRDSAEAEAKYSAVSALARQRLEGMGKPLIAMINGFCIGGGCATAMVADIRITAEDGRFGIPAAKLGVAYAWHSLRRLVALVGPAMAKEIMFTGRFLDAQEALRAGLVNRVVPVEQLETTVREMALTIARNAPLSIRASKEGIDQIAGEPSRIDQSRFEALYRACFDSADYAEGRTAFMAKRPPVFKGG